MKAEFTAIIEAAPKGGGWAVCPCPVPMVKGRQLRKLKIVLRQAIELILEDRKADILRGLPDDAIQDTVMVG